MKFFHYSQNNSGGVFDIDIDKGITPDVIIEARDAKHADERAQEIGIYFYGIDSGYDCECCGDRWSKQWSDECGKDVPSIYDTPVGESKKSYGREIAAIHYADGRMEIVERR